jgi:predicted phage baseplate assembly protein
MPLQLPTLDDRNFEQLLLEAQARIPGYTPEWTNHGIESDPGITIVELFAFLTESFLYRLNRFPERNRLKFLQLLGIPLQPAAAADGIIVIHNERGPVQPLPLDSGVVVTAGNVNFLTQDSINVLPLEVQVYYKRRIAKTDERYAEFATKYEAIRAAAVAAAEATETPLTSTAADNIAVELAFYETTPLQLPTASNPSPTLNLLGEEMMDNALYLALLAPQNVRPADVREVIAGKTLSIGIVPAPTSDVPPLRPRRRIPTRSPIPNLVYESADVGESTNGAQYQRLKLIQQPDVLSEVGIVLVELPDESGLQTWTFTEPMQEGTGDYPPRLEDQKVSERLVTWVRLRLPVPDSMAQPTSTTAAGPASGRVSQPAVLTNSGQGGTLNARLTWVGINAARVTQAIPIVNELLGAAPGVLDQNVAESDQVVTLVNTPVIPSSLRLEVEDINSVWRLWQQTDDLLAADENAEVFTLDPESGQIRFGDGLHGARPQPGGRIRASYRCGGGTQGNVAIGAIKASPNEKLQGGYKIENPVSTWGGDIGETVAQGEKNIPLYLRTRDRLVTSEDFADITRRTSGVDVGRVEVLPLFHPDRPDDAAAGVVTLMVVPAFDSVRPLWPTPNRIFLRKVCDYLDDRRLVTTEIYVRGPVYVPVYLSVGIEVRGGFFRDKVIEAVTNRLNEYLSALPPGGPENQGWPINKRLMKKDLEAVITRVPGVEFVVSMELGVGAALNLEEYSLSGLKLPLLQGLSVREGEAEPLATIGAAVPPDTRIVPVPVTKSKC